MNHMLEATQIAVKIYQLELKKGFTLGGKFVFILSCITNNNVQRQKQKEKGLKVKLLSSH